MPTVYCLLERSWFIELDVVLLGMINTDLFQNCRDYYEGLLNFMEGGCYLCLLFEKRKFGF